MESSRVASGFLPRSGERVDSEGEEARAERRREQAGGSRGGEAEEEAGAGATAERRWPAAAAAAGEARRCGWEAEWVSWF
jgi:hypothetical protein